MKILLGILVAIVAIAAAGLLAVAAVLGIRRSGRKHGSSGGLGIAMLEVQSLFEPAKRHAVVASKDEAESAHEDASGDPPE